MLLKLARNGLGGLVVLMERLTRPRAMTRSAEDQELVQQALDGHVLYQLFACPFCVKTRRAVHKLGVELETRDIGKNPQFRRELESGGGRVMVPCLRIEEEGGSRWMYESADIISYLQRRVG